MLVIPARGAASFGGVVGTWTNDVNAATWTVTLTNAIAAGKVAVALIGWEDANPPTLSSLSDTKSNPWVLVHQQLNNSVHNIAAAYAVITNAISSGDSLTLTWSGSDHFERGVTVMWLDGVSTTSPLESNFKTNIFGSNIVSTVSSSAGSIVVQHIQAQQFASGSGNPVWYTNTGSAFTFPTTNMDFGHTATTSGLRHFMGYKANATSGSYAMGGWYTELGLPHDESYLVSIMSFKGADTRYIDYATGADTNDGLTTATPWKRCTGDTNATSNAASYTPGPGTTFVFKGGVVYNGCIAVKQTGSSTSAITYEGNSTNTGWGSGYAKIDLQTNLYTAFTALTGTQNYININGFDVYNARNNNNGTNQTVNIAGVDTTGVNYRGNGDIDCEGELLHDKGGSFWNVTNCRVHDVENAYWRAVLNSESDPDPLTSSEIPATKAGITFYNGAHSCTMSNVELYAIGRTAIKVMGCTNWLIINCNIGGDTNLVTQTNQGWFAVGVKPIGVGSWGSQGRITQTVFHDGWQYQGDESQQRCHAGDWIHMFGDNDGINTITGDPYNILVDRCTFYNNHTWSFNNGTSYVFMESDVFNIEFRNCLFINGFSGDIEFRDTENLTINNCTFLDYNTQPLLFKTGTHYNATNVVLKNNIYYSASANSANVPAGTSSVYGGAIPTSDYNIYYAPNNGNNTWAWTGTNRNLAAWRTFSGQDAHSQQGNFTLVNMLLGTTSGFGDYHPTTNSIAVGTGTTLSFTPAIDFDGTTRTVPWTIGALLSNGTGGGGGGGGTTNNGGPFFPNTTFTLPFRYP